MSRGACHLSTVLGHRRAELGLTLADVAERANMTAQGVRYVEDGMLKRPSFHQIMRLCRALDIDPWTLI